MLLLRRQHGNSIFLLFFYKFIKNIFAFFSLFMYGMLLCLFINVGYITQFTYEQLIIVIILLCSVFLKKEKQYAIIPYLIRIPKIEIRKYVLTKELLSAYNFIIIPLIIPLFLMNKVEWSTNASILVFMNSFLVGLFINLSIRIVKFFCNKERLCYLITIAFISAYIIILVITRHKAIEFSYFSWLTNYYSIIVSLIGISFMVPFYMYIIKQESYLLYDNDSRNESRHYFGIEPMLTNIFNKLHILQLIRSKGTRKFVSSILLCIGGGLSLYLFVDFKLLGLSVYLGAYTLNMIQFTIYLNSDYFDALCTKPLSIKSLLLNAFNIHLCITSILFILLFIYITMCDNQFIWPFISIYLYISGPMAFILFFNILFAQKYDSDSVESEFSIQRTSAQKIIGLIAAFTLFGVLAIIQLFPTIGCYIVMTISIMVIMSYHYWINFLYKRFMNRRYQIMGDLRT